LAPASGKKTTNMIIQWDLSQRTAPSTMSSLTMAMREVIFDPISVSLASNADRKSPQTETYRFSQEIGVLKNSRNSGKLMLLSSMQ
jgi:hypothetical protein